MIYPEVSVIVPTYNRADRIERTLDSVYAQTYRPIELIIVDDGSTDNTKAVVQEWSSRLPGDGMFYVQYIYQENQGACTARNHGAEIATGDYLQFFDSDDLMHPRKLEIQIAEMKKYGSDWSVCAERRYTDDNCEVHYEEFCRESFDTYKTAVWKTADLTQSGPAGSRITGSLVITGACFLGIGGWNKKLALRDDTELFVRLLCSVFKGIGIAAELYVLLQASESMTRSVSCAERWKKVSLAFVHMMQLDCIQPHLSEYQAHVYNKVFMAEFRRYALVGDMKTAGAVLKTAWPHLTKRNRLMYSLMNMAGRLVGFRTLKNMKNRLLFA